MGRRRHTPEQIITALREAEVGLASGKTDLFVRHGPPEHLRSDNGPEFTAQLVRRWLARLGVQTLYIEPGSPW